MDKGTIILRFVLAVILCISTGMTGMAQLPVPSDIGNVHPRCFGKEMSREAVRQLAAQEEWAQQIIYKTEERVSRYLDHCEEDPEWLLSRLQMYWKTRSTQVYIDGGKYDHAEGEAPVPTVRFPGTRDHRTDYFTPRLEDVKPYMDDERGLYLQRRDNKQWEWTGIVSSARIVESVNRNILEIARDAAFMYWYTGKEDYARLAFGVLDTYLTGLYYRAEPIDLSHGHHQTLVGLTSFEVIQEHYIAEVTQAYDFLYDYISANYSGKIALYSAGFQKWADQVIKNGVSFNNWNLFQAGHVSRIALVLENDLAYKNGKGAQYYLDRITNQNSTRQWSLTKLIDYGYDPDTGIWNESPGYALGVLRDFIRFAAFYDHTFDIDLIAKLPVLRQAVIAAPQYLYPNGYRVAFGDGHYGKPEAGPVLYMIENAKKYGKETDEVFFTRMLKTLFDENSYADGLNGRHIENLFAEAPLKIRKDIRPGKLEDFTAPLFYAPNTSWLVQRQGTDESGLMISQIGSKGNHMHSNGIAMELYGLGLPLAPELGNGPSYFSAAYAEYYSQFPAHNTVIVNGKSRYPEMKSNHAFTCNAAYPESGKQEGNLPGFTFSDVSFLEPETYSDQRRVMGIVSDEENGYYIDIFRSAQREGKDVKHEYFYHNLGQSLDLKDIQGNPLDLEPTSKMAFGDGDLMAYDYMWDKKSTEFTDDFTGQFNLETANKTVTMNLWVKGESDREIFSAMSPKSTAFRHGPLPEAFNDLPVPTLVIRQNGEAWNRPFVAVYQPALNGASNIRSVDYFGKNEQAGIRVTGRSGKEDFILSTTNGDQSWKHKDISLTGTYGVISVKDNNLKMFLGHGRSLGYKKYTLRTEEPASLAFAVDNGQWYVMTTAPACLDISVNDVKADYQLEDANGNSYQGTVDKKTKQVRFNLPVLEHTPVKLKISN